MKKRPFIIDCDTGTDDAIALVAALGCEEMEIIGITSVNGNVSEYYTSHNNLRLMEYLGRDIPVCRGAYLPLTGNRETAAIKTIHGRQGLGDVELPEAVKTDFCSQLASEFIYSKAVEYRGELELLVTGPMTNIAITYIQHPDLKDLIRHLYFMGGSVTQGNITSSAEYNFWVDPEACHVVLDSGMPLTMVGLNVSNRALVGPKEIEIISQYRSRETRLVADILQYKIKHTRLGFNIAGMHDPLSLAGAVYPQCLKFEDFYVDAEYFGHYTRGHTAVDVNHRSGKPANVSVAVDIDVEAFRNWLCEKVILAGKLGNAGREN